MTKTCSLTQAAATLGIHRNTIAGWLERGCLAETRADRAKGWEWELSIPALFQWRIDDCVKDAVSGYHDESGAISKDEADRRRAVALAIVAEVEADTILNNVMNRPDALASMADFCQVLKSGLGNAAQKTAARAATMTSPAEIQDFCEAEFNRSFRAARCELDRLWRPDGAEPDAG